MLKERQIAINLIVCFHLFRFSEIRTMKRKGLKQINDCQIIPGVWIHSHVFPPFF